MITDTDAQVAMGLEHHYHARASLPTSLFDIFTFISILHGLEIEDLSFGRIGGRVSISLLFNSTYPLQGRERGLELELRRIKGGKGGMMICRWHLLSLHMDERWGGGVMAGMNWCRLLEHGVLWH